MNFRRIVALAHKEWREILRDRLFFTLAFVVPASLMLIFGYGLTLDVEHIPFAVVDQDKTARVRYRASANWLPCWPTAASGSRLSSPRVFRRT